MRTLLFVLAVVAIAAMADDNPVFPIDELCSIKGKGSATLKVLTNEFAGTAVMKRVRNSLRIDVTSQVAKFSLIGRGDLGKAATDMVSCQMSIQPGCYEAGSSINLNGYSFTGEVDLPQVSANKFTHSSNNAAMYFSLTDNKLIGEEFSITLEGAPVTLTVMYTTVESYNRTDAADGAFNSDQCHYSGNDEYAITSKCTESESSSTPNPLPPVPPAESSNTGAAGVIVPSIALLLTAAVLLL